jgi:hypothetical protein
MANGHQGNFCVVRHRHTPPLSLVVVQIVPPGQHAIVKHPDDANAVGLTLEEHDVPPLFLAHQPRTDVIARASAFGFFRERLEAGFQRVDVDRALLFPLAA